MQNKQIFQNTYSAEDLCSIEADIYEAFENDNPVIREIPMDEDNFFMRGEFTVTITWKGE